MSEAAREHVMPEVKAVYGFYGKGPLAGLSDNQLFEQAQNESDEISKPARKLLIKNSVQVDQMESTYQNSLETEAFSVGQGINNSSQQLSIGL